MSTLKAFYQKIVSFFLAVFAVLFPLRGATGDLQGVTVTVPEVTTATEQIDMTIQNNSGTTISYGLDSFTLEKRTLAGWTTMQKRSDYVVLKILLMLEPGAVGQLHVNLPLAYGKTLDKGTYRMTFSYNMQEQGRGAASVTFTVKA